MTQSVSHASLVRYQPQEQAETGFDDKLQPKA